MSDTPVTDRSAARRALLTRYKDDPSQAPFPGAVGLRCSDCTKFLLWVSPPAPSVPVLCSECPDCGDSSGVLAVVSR